MHSQGNGSSDRPRPINTNLPTAVDQISVPNHARLSLPPQQEPVTLTSFQSSNQRSWQPLPSVVIRPPPPQSVPSDSEMDEFGDSFDDEGK